MEADFQCCSCFLCSYTLRRWLGRLSAETRKSVESCVFVSWRCTHIRTTYLITHLHHTSHYKHTNTHTTYNPPHIHLCTHRVKPSHVLPCIHFFPPSLGHLLCISCTCLSSLQRSGISLSPPKPHPGWCLALKTPCHGYHSHPLCHLVCLLANSRLEPRL